MERNIYFYLYDLLPVDIRLMPTIYLSTTEAHIKPMNELYKQRCIPGPERKINEFDFHAQCHLHEWFVTIYVGKESRA